MLTKPKTKIHFSKPILILAIKTKRPPIKNYN